MLFSFVVMLMFISACKTGEQTAQQESTDSTGFYSEAHRPQLHFSPKEKWMNDPNGMILHNGEYHLFYQFYPGGTTWGPMHWGHAISKDLVRWQHLPIALYPDSLGLIFSGSAVIDKENSTGFGTKENPPMVAIFTYHSMEKEKAGRSDYQSQGIAYSNDNGRTWKKYEGNPVLKNQGVKDFRDPKVFYHDESRKWVMILAVKDHIELWASADLKSWNKLSEFGYEYGGHGGVWECPDLFKLKIDGENKVKWVMLVSINPGGPNGGSATQYFAGEFDGRTFIPEVDKSQMVWIDHGPDNYAGVTFSNVPNDRKIFLGWMSNWAYAQEVPTHPWRSAMTAPRDLSLKRVNDKLYVRSFISPEFIANATDVKNLSSLIISGETPVQEAGDVSKSVVKATFDAKAFTITLSNERNQMMLLGFDASENKFFIDRSKSGKIDFSKNYNVKSFAPRISTIDKINVTMVIDVASIEVFFDDGVTVMTSVFFSDLPLSNLIFTTKEKMTVSGVSIIKLPSIW
jgi:fructan beta-fructosidase